MKEAFFKHQFRNAILIIIAGVVLSHLFKTSLFSNIAWIVYGLIYVIHPRDLHNLPLTPKGETAVRIAGAVIAFIGIISRFGV